MTPRNDHSSLGGLCLAALSLWLGGCSSVQTLDVDSKPPGARVLVDGVDEGLVTPAQLSLSTGNKEYRIRLEKNGYNPVERTVRLSSDVDVMEPEEVAWRILCAPCCCGLSLPGLLSPIDVDQSFVPWHIDATLEPAGQGLKLDVQPRDAEVYADGRLYRPIDGKYLVLQPGDHEVEVRRDGYRPYVRIVHIEPLIYEDLDVDLDVEGQGLLLTVNPPGAKVYIDGQYQGTLAEKEHRLRTSAGPRELRIERDGYAAFQDVVTIEVEEYRTMEITLTLAGQGVLVHKPSGLRRDQTDIKILVDGAVHATEFGVPILLEPGQHELRIDVAGYEVWATQVKVTQSQYLEIEPALKRLRKDT